MRIHQWKTILGLLVVTFCTNACYMEVHEDDDKKKTGWTHSSSSGSELNFLPENQRSGTQTCDQYQINGNYVLNCYERDNRKYLSNCSSDRGCQTVAVSINYLLQENLGMGKTVVVEAFNADGAQNYPAAVTKVFNFDATHAGTSAMESMFLAAGNYYFRAYLSDDDFSTPFEYKGMDKVEQQMVNQPYGTYGASGVASVQVNGSAENKPQSPVIVNLNRLFRKAGEERPTNANLRIGITVDPATEVPAGKDVIIKLYGTNDFRVNPIYTFKFSSNLLKIEGQKGKAEYIATNLKAGDYFVQAFLDDSGNGYADPGELQDTYKKGDEQAKMSVVENRTDKVDLKLVR